jgi:hypothetical protein
MTMNLINSHITEFRTAPLPEGVVLDNTYVLKRVANPNGNGSIVAPATGTGFEDIVGLAHVPPLQATTVAVVNEPHAVSVAGTITTPYSIVGGAYVFDNTSETEIAPANYSIVNNVITFAAGHVPSATDEILVSYRRPVTLAELGQSGLPLDFANQFTGSNGGIEFATGSVNLQTDFFDATVAYEIGQPLYVTPTGILTSTASPNGKIVGTVNFVPSNSLNVLGVSAIWNF